MALTLLLAVGIADLFLRLPRSEPEERRQTPFVVYAIGGLGLAAGGMILAVLWKEGGAGLGFARHWLAVVLLGLLGAAAGAWLALRHQPPKEVTPTTPSTTGDEAVARTIGWLLVAVAVGALGQVLWAWGLGLPKLADKFWLLLGVNLLISGAAAILGGVLGFLFGIPRTALPNGELAAGTLPAETSTAARLVANTNLERVSDWLTTLLIGATLTQLVNIPTALWALADQLTSFDTSVPPLVSEGYQTVVVAIMVYFFLTGFLGLYLITRLYLTEAFQDVLERAGVLPPASGPAALEDVLQRAGEALAEPNIDPEGALKILDEIKTNAAAWRTRPLQALRARALARRWSVEKEKASSQEVLDATRNEVLEALKAAAEEDESMQTQLRGQLAPGKDLKDFKNDPDVKTLLSVPQQ